MRPTPEQLEIQALAREFAEGEIRPRSAAWDEARHLDQEVFSKLGELGFLGMLVPEDQGGLGFDVPTYLLVVEELARGDAAVALSVAIHSVLCSTILRHGSTGQQARWLGRLAAGEALGAFALSEPSAGSDAAAVECGAETTGDGWRLSGTKRWVTNGARAGVVVVFGRTGSDALGAFLVEPGTPGYRVGALERTLGLRASETATVHLDGVDPGPEGVLGDPGAGFAYAMEALDLGRVGVAAQALGVARAAMEHAVGYALDRRQFGRALAEFGATRAKVAEMHRRIAAARAMTHHAGGVMDDILKGKGSLLGAEGARVQAAAAKLTASEAATWVADEAVQIFGGYGYMREYPVEKLLRDAKGTEIYEGTSEIMRHIIAREVFRAAREDEWRTAGTPGDPESR
jgi:alkylation response protein AidB-like acyl-CoA dehydrogenase